MVFIFHDPKAIRLVADDIAVMHRGRIVQQAACGALLTAPQHPYSRTLIAAIPRLAA